MQNPLLGLTLSCLVSFSEVLGGKNRKKFQKGRIWAEIGRRKSKKELGGEDGKGGRRGREREEGVQAQTDSCSLECYF